jgi:hypothetical protein
MVPSCSICKHPFRRIFDLDMLALSFSLPPSVRSLPPSREFIPAPPRTPVSRFVRGESCSSLLSCTIPRCARCETRLLPFLPILPSPPAFPPPRSRDPSPPSLPPHSLPPPLITVMVVPAELARAGASRTCCRRRLDNRTDSNPSTQS